MTQSKARKVRPKLVPISSSSGSAGKGNYLSRSFDDGGLGFGDILTGASTSTAPDAPVAVAEPASGVLEIGNDIDINNKHGSYNFDNNHVVYHEETGVTRSGGDAVGVAEELLHNGKNNSLPEDDNSSTVSDDNDDESLSSSESDSESSNVNNHQHWQKQPNDETHGTSVEKLLQLQSEIHARQKLLSKILRGREGTAYATMIENQETLVNSQLMDRLRMKEGISIASYPSAVVVSEISSYSRPRPPSAIQSILLDEFYHTLPGAMSLIVHCALYVTTYALIAHFVNLLCDILIVQFTGWDIKTNDFDCTLYEHAFHAMILCMSILASRITGVVYDWNDNKMYQKRIAFQLRNKWILQFWDAKLLNFFNADLTRMKYYSYENLPCWDEGNDDAILRDDTSRTTGATTTPITSRHRNQRQRKKMFGWRLKFIFDLFSFFFCYKSVEHFLYNGCMIPLSEITDLVWDNLPSRQQQPQLHQQERAHDCHGSSDIANIFDCRFDGHPYRKVQPDQHRYHSGCEKAAGVSYACHNVRSALENPYALDMLTWIAGIKTESDVVTNWIANARNCGWSGVVARAEETDSQKCDRIITSNDDVAHHQTCMKPGPIREETGNTCEKPIEEGNHFVSYYPEKRKISALDDKYIQSIISREAYHEFIRYPDPRFFDSVKVQLFLFVTTVICLGLLYVWDIPFLLI